jgi:hypothetical protein
MASRIYLAGFLRSQPALHQAGNLIAVQGPLLDQGVGDPVHGVGVVDEQCAKVSRVPGNGATVKQPLSLGPAQERDVWMRAPLGRSERAAAAVAGRGDRDRDAGRSPVDNGKCSRLTTARRQIPARAQRSIFALLPAQPVTSMRPKRRPAISTHSDDPAARRYRTRSGSERQKSSRTGK